jgi:hypothetical protein
MRLQRSRNLISKEDFMARIIEFYIPSRFTPKEKCLPEKERGRVLVFPVDLKKSA